jgi:hypothetical protein
MILAAVEDLALLSLTAARDQMRDALSGAGKHQGDDDGQGARARARMARIDAWELWSRAREAARHARWRPGALPGARWGARAAAVCGRSRVRRRP